MVQAVYPGGQAAHSVTYTGPSGVRRSIFPDLIAVLQSQLMVGEAKPKYSESDARKLRELSRSAEAVRSLRRLISLRAPTHSVGSLVFFLAHSTASARPVEDLHQFVLKDGEVRLILPIGSVAS